MREITPTQELYFEWSLKKLERALRLAPPYFKDLQIIEKAVQYKRDLKSHYDLQHKLGIISWWERLYIRYKQGV